MYRFCLLHIFPKGPRHDEDLREPLVRRQGSQVSMRVARVPAHLENIAVATGLEKVSFHSNPKERQCQSPLATRMDT